MLSRITDFASSSKGKWVVTAVWALLAAVIVPFSPMLSDVVTNDESTFLPDGAESTEVQQLVEERFPSDTTPAIVAFHNDQGLTEEQRATAEELGQWARSDEAPDNIVAASIVSIFTSPQASDRLVSDDGTTMTMVIGIEGNPSSTEYLDTVRAIREQVESPPEGVQIFVSGPAGLLLDLISVFDQINVFLTLVTAALVLVLLIIIYRSPVIAFVPLIAVGWVFLLAGAIAAFGSQCLDYLVNGQAQGVMTVLLFGAGTDYCLFISSRFREELRRIEDKHEAMQASMRAVGGAISSSAGTNLVAALILLLATLRSTSALGPLLSIAIGLMFIAAMTLVPALITILGRLAFWSKRPPYEPEEEADEEAETKGVWGRVAGAVTKRPVVALTSAVAVFALFSLGLFEYRVTYDTISSLPEGTEAGQGFEHLREAFPAGRIAPITVYAELPDGASVYDNIDEIDAMIRILADFEDVAYVESVSAPLGTNGQIGADQVAAATSQLPQDIRNAIAEGTVGQPGGAEGASDPALQQAIGVYAATRQYVSPDNEVARFNVILESSPYALEQINRIGDFRDYARTAADEAGVLGEVLVGGEPATAYDTKQATEHDQRLIIPLILLAIAIILGLLLRSVIAPLYLLGTIVLGYTATLGVSTFLFLNVFGDEGLSSALPLFLFVFSAALGIDYSIYLMMRIREETEEHELREGVRVALSRTGGVITSAGIILAGTFAALMTLPLRDLFQIGLAVAIGVLFDTFVTRTVIVPGIVVLLGRWNWWPSKRSQKQQAG